MEKLFSSVALRSLSERFAAGAKLQVLDLGKASGANIDYYSKFARNMYVEDLFWTVSQERESNALKAKRLVERINSIPPQTKVDIICCWDVLNYLSSEELQEVSDFLSRYAHKETLLFALMHTQPEMPEQPSLFKIKGDCVVSWEESAEGKSAAPGYTKRFMERVFPHFVRQRSVLLRSGMEEQVYQAKIN